MNLNEILRREIRYIVRLIFLNYSIILVMIILVLKFLKNVLLRFNFYLCDSGFSLVVGEVMFFVVLDGYLEFCVVVVFFLVVRAWGGI